MSTPLPIAVTNTGDLRAALNARWSRALSTVYPKSNFSVTADNGTTPAPGQPNNGRVYSNTPTVDPRANSSGLWQLVTGNNSDLQAAMGSPQNITGGSVVNNFTDAKVMGVPLWAILLGAVALFFFWRKA
jgi:hypothetical protein